MLQQTLHLLFEFIKTPIGNWTVLGLTLVIILAVLYDQNRQIPGLSVEQIIEDTWFVTRDDPEVRRPMFRLLRDGGSWRIPVSCWGDVLV